MHPTMLKSLLRCPATRQLPLLLRPCCAQREFCLSLPRAFTSSLDFSRHALNINDALKKAVESHPLSELVLEDVSILQGIGPVHLEALQSLGIQTVHDLAVYRFFHRARAIVALAETEEPDGRAESSSMNINKAVDKAYENKSFREMALAPPAALQGLSEEKGELLQQHFGIKTIKDLAEFKFCRWAESMVALEPSEETEEEESSSL